LPTRARPKRLKQFLDSVYRLAESPQQIEVILFIDDDDDSMFNFEYSNLKIKKIIQARNTMGFYNTACFNISEGKIIMAVNDDIVVRTFAWDKQILDFHLNQPDPIYLAYPNDLHKKERLPTFPILSRETCESLQAIFPADYKGSFLDLHLFDIFMRLKKYGLNRVFFLNKIVFEHLHFRNKKSKIDETYQQRNRFSDDCVFVALAKFRREEADRLIRNYFDANHKNDQMTFRVFQRQQYKKSFFKNTILYFSCFILDQSLSLRWRIYLFYYFMARLIFSEYIYNKVINSSFSK